MKKLIKIVSLILAMTFVFASCSNNNVFTTSGDETTTAAAGTIGNLLGDETQANETTTAAAGTIGNLLGDETQANETTNNTPSVSGHQRVKFTMENGGVFIIELYPEYAPKTVDNFVKLVSEGFYDGLTFHRIIENFMAQGGDPLGTGFGGSDKEIYGEFTSNGFLKNTLSHKRGVVSMARSGDPNSASSQFFICYADASGLDGDYAAFGKVVEGMEVVDSFLDVKRVYGSDGELSKPQKPIVIEKAEVIL